MAMFPYGLACSLEETSMGAPIILRGEIEYIAEVSTGLGCEVVELQMRDPQNHDWARLRRVAEQAGLRYSAIATGREIAENGLSLIDSDPAVRRACVEKLKLHIDMGEAIGAMVIVGSVRSKIPDFDRYDHYIGLVNDATLELADYAAGKGVVILVENITAGISNFLNTMRQVTDYVNGLGRDNIRVHLDTYSMLLEENDIVGAVEYCAPRLDYVHFSDSSRLFPGGGNVDFKAFLKILRKIGYGGAVVLECVPLPDGETCARNGLDYIRALEECIRIETSFVR